MVRNTADVRNTINIVKRFVLLLKLLTFVDLCECGVAGQSGGHFARVSCDALGFKTKKWFKSIWNSNLYYFGAIL